MICSMHCLIDAVQQSATYPLLAGSPEARRVDSGADAKELGTGVASGRFGLRTGDGRQNMAGLATLG